jgi:MOSC domain-containing protein YiiM
MIMSIGKDARIIQLNISPGGLPKQAIHSAEVTRLGITGDVQRNKKYHGGPSKALLLIAAEVIDTLKQEGWPLFYGALGENLTTEGLDHRQWRAGQRFQAGGVCLELTTPRQPCRNLYRYGTGLAKQIYDAGVKRGNPSSIYWGMSGFYASVIEEGNIHTLDRIKPVEGRFQAAVPR